MADRPRVVYSTGAGNTPAKRQGATAETVPDRIVAKLRMERAGRSGKTVTVIDGLPRNPEFLASLAQELKRACGAGGKPGDGVIELQGELRDRVRELLTKKGYVVKG